MIILKKKFYCDYLLKPFKLEFLIICLIIIYVFSHFGLLLKPAVETCCSLSSTISSGTFSFRLIGDKQLECLDVRHMGNRGDGGWDVCLSPPYRPQLDNCLVYSFGSAMQILSLCLFFVCADHCVFKLNRSDFCSGLQTTFLLMTPWPRNSGVTSCRLIRV